MRVAIVDDSPLVRTMLSQHVKAFGHEPAGIAPTAVFDVLRSLREFEIGLMIVDLQMPACPGLSLIRAVREDPKLAKLPILVYTAHLDETASFCLQQLKVNAVAQKPMNPKDLDLEIQRALQGSAWSPGPQRARITLIDEIDSRRHHLSELLHQAGHLAQELDQASCFDIMGTLVKAPPVLLVISLGCASCPVLSLVRLIREDPRLYRIPILAFGHPAHGVPHDALKQFNVHEMEGIHTPGRLFESIEDVLENLDIHLDKT